MVGAAENKAKERGVEHLKALGFGGLLGAGIYSLYLTSHICARIYEFISISSL
jgi:hypothetical protein